MLQFQFFLDTQPKYDLRFVFSFRKTATCSSTLLETSSKSNRNWLRTLHRVVSKPLTLLISRLSDFSLKKKEKKCVFHLETLNLTCDAGYKGILKISLFWKMKTLKQIIWESSLFSNFPDKRLDIRYFSVVSKIFVTMFT